MQKRTDSYSDTYTRTDNYTGTNDYTSANDYTHSDTYTCTNVLLRTPCSHLVTVASRDMSWKVMDTQPVPLEMGLYLIIFKTAEY